MAFELDKFKNPEAKYRANTIKHGWPPDKRALLMRAMKDYGFGGVVTNVPFDNGFTSNPDNLAEFDAIIKDLEEAGLSYWIYDENTCPSGIGDGRLVKMFPELEAKGFYMRRFVAYAEPRRVDYRLDPDSDKIVWAAKYPRDYFCKHGSHIVVERMEAVPFAAGGVTCELGANEVLFIFSVKPAYDGSNQTQNDIAQSRYINIMDPDAVRKIIDLFCEPAASSAPGAYRKAGAIFTDEPHLMTFYMSPEDQEVWQYALAPWVDGLFEEFEDEYGFSLLPYLPFVFEGSLKDSCAIRVKFQKLVGKLVARAYTSQLADWCKAHGTLLSGHYLGEELMSWHVMFYGDMIEAMMGADYPGLDVLCLLPEQVGYNKMKFMQIVSRKKGTNGMMVEFTPFINFAEFQKSLLDNAAGTLNLLYLNGVRVVNSYLIPEYGDYDESLEGFKNMSPSEYLAYIDTYKDNPHFAEGCASKNNFRRSEAIWFNEYIGRLGYMLDDTPNYTDVFVYYPLEDVQAKAKPIYTSATYIYGIRKTPDDVADTDMIELTSAIYEAGHDYNFADIDDLVAAAESLAQGGKPAISGFEVKAVVVPPMDVMYGESLRALAALSDAGVAVLFNKRLPSYGVGAIEDLSAYTARYAPSKTESIIESLDAACGSDFSARIRCDGGESSCSGGGESSCSGSGDSSRPGGGESSRPGGAALIKARFKRDGKEMYFVCNNSRAPIDVLFGHRRKPSATLYNPADGGAMPVRMGEAYTLPSFRGVFVMFD